MKIFKRLLISIMVIAIASAQWVPAFAVSDDKTANGDAVPVKAKAAIVMDADTGEILYEKNASVKREPASITKIVTCLVVLEHLELDREVTAKHDGNPTGNVINIKKGEVFTVEQLLYALMVASANDAAVVLAEEVAGSEEAFCKLMNEKARECGAKNSNFENPNGLNWPGDEDQLTTAYDLAVITQEALKDEIFAGLVSTAVYEMPATNKHGARTLVSTNKFLWDDEALEIVKTMPKTKFGAAEDAEIWVPDHREGVIGVKTGMTSTAGACYVGAVNHNGTRLIAVVLGSVDDYRFRDAELLWDYAIENFYETHVIAASGKAVESVRVKRGEVRTVNAVPEQDVVITVSAGRGTDKVKTKIETEKLKAPVKKGQVIGSISLYDGKKLVCQRDLIAGEKVDEGGFLSVLGIPDMAAPFVYIAIVLILLIVLVLRRLKHV